VVSTFTYAVEFLRDFGFFDIVLPGLLVGIPLFILFYRVFRYKVVKFKPENVLNAIVAVLLALFATFILVQIFLMITNFLPVYNEVWSTINWIITIIIFVILVILLIKIDFKRN